MSWIRRNVVAVAALGFFFSTGLGCHGSSTPTPPPVTATISGAVTGATSVTVTLTPGGTVATTSTGGAYSFAGLASATYTVTPSKAGFTFAPATRQVVLAGADVAAQDFTATAVIPTFQLGGTVHVGAGGPVLAGVSVALSGAAAGNTLTSAAGLYAFAGLLGGSYGVAATKAGYQFTPAGVAAVTIGTASATQDFVAAGVRTVAGTVRVGTLPLAGVTVTVGTQTATSDVAGAYLITGLEPKSLAVTAARTGYTFPAATTDLTAANATGVDFLAATSPLLSIQGTVTGPWVEKVTVTLSGGAALTATTNATGGYAFSGLADGTIYTVTPSLPGYAYAPAAPAVSLAGASKTQDFVASSVVASRTISGTVTYAGAGTGTFYVGAYSSTCTGCSPIAGTSLASTATPRSFLIRGLPNGSYVVRARLDTIGAGAENGSLPGGQSGTVDVTAANATGVAVTVTDPTLGTPAQVTGVAAMPGSGAALVFWDKLTNGANGTEIATGYRLQASTTAAFPAGATTSTVELLARDDAMYIHAGAGVTAGSTWYFRVAAKFGATVGTYSAVAGPYTLGAPAGGTTVSVSVAFTGAATGPLYVGLYAGGGSGGGPTDIRFIRVAAPMTGMVHAITNVPAGDWTPFAILDQNSNGVVDSGDLNDTGGQSARPPVTVPTAATVAEVLSSANAAVGLNTRHTWDGASNHWYGESARVTGLVKHPVNVILWSGPAVPVPFDMGKSWEFSADLYNGLVAPVVGGTYRFRVTYTDGTVEDLSQTLDVLYTAPGAFATGLTEDVVSAGCSPTVPCFDWMAPLAGPAGYGYRFHLDGAGAWWDYPQNNLLAPTMTTATFNSDGRASVPALTSGTPYQWTVMVVDPAGNQAGKTRNYTPSSGSCTTVDLGSAGGFAILAKSAISTVPSSAITGNVGISPAAATFLTGFSETADASNVFSTSPQVTGKIYASTYSPPTPANMTTAVLDMETAFTAAAGKAPGLGLTDLGAGNVGGMTLAAGCYKWGTGLLVPTDVTLTGSATDVWVFMIAQDLTFSNGVKVTLAGGALAKNVFWQVSGLVSVGTTAHVEGIVLSKTAITLGTLATVNGRLLAQTAVSVDQGTVVQPAP
jgi:hypothetical protein